MSEININESVAIIKDPFKKDWLHRVNVSFYPKGPLGNGGPKAYGVVDFVNGNTKGEQSFEGESFDDVVLKMKAVLETLK